MILHHPQYPVKVERKYLNQKKKHLIHFLYSIPKNLKNPNKAKMPINV